MLSVLGHKCAHARGCSKSCIAFLWNTSGSLGSVDRISSGILPKPQARVVCTETLEGVVFVNDIAECAHLLVSLASTLARRRSVTVSVLRGREC